MLDIFELCENHSFLLMCSSAEQEGNFPHNLWFIVSHMEGHSVLAVTQAGHWLLKIPFPHLEDRKVWRKGALRLGGQSNSGFHDWRKGH